MFKILVIQAHNNLSEDRAEFLINDRLSFMRFLGLGLADKAPDAKTIWIFRERLTRAGAIEKLFARFDQAVRTAGYIPMSGQIVDARLVATPKQRNTDGEKADLRPAAPRRRGPGIRPSCARRTAIRANEKARHGEPGGLNVRQLAVVQISGGLSVRKALGAAIFISLWRLLA